MNYWQRLWIRAKQACIPFTSEVFSFPKRPLLLTTVTIFSCSLPSLRFLANNPWAFNKLFPKLPSPRYSSSFNESSLGEDSGTQTPSWSKCPSPRACLLPRMTSSKARSSNVFLLFSRRGGRVERTWRGGDWALIFPVPKKQTNKQNSKKTKFLE